LRKHLVAAHGVVKDQCAVGEEARRGRHWRCAVTDVALARRDGILQESTEGSTVAYRKTAIAVPEALLADVDRAASERGVSRSAYITRVLTVAVRAKRDAEITRKLDELFADVRLTKAQRRGAAVLDRVGTDWTDERW
jgi:hypothetical protein